MSTTRKSTEWRTHDAAQQPTYPDPERARRIFRRLSQRKPLVQPAEIDALNEKLRLVCIGEAFILQAGSCAELFGTPLGLIKNLVQVVLQMTVVLMYGTGVQIVKLGRWAGQYGKPRSKPTENTKNGVLLSFRGDIVHSADATEAARVHDPARALMAHTDAKRTLAEVRRLTSKGGIADLAKLRVWNREFIEGSPEGALYDEYAELIDESLRFIAACGIDLKQLEDLTVAEVFSSHEALVLEYEHALTRRVVGSDGSVNFYDLSGAFLWIGERTRSRDGAHVAMFRRLLKNPIGIKLGPGTTPDDVRWYCETFNPGNIPGKLTFISRMGAGKIRSVLPALMRAAKDAGCPVIWVCDPMHGNTVTVNGYKTRILDQIMDEIAGFFEACEQAGVWPGGIHVEITGEYVTECLGGDKYEITESDLSVEYTTACDPRLNARQAIQVAFFVARRFKQYRANMARLLVTAA